MTKTRLGLPGGIRARLFDLDGVLTETARLHAIAWQQMFDEFLSRGDGRSADPSNSAQRLANGGDVLSFAPRLPDGLASPAFSIVRHKVCLSQTRRDMRRGYCLKRFVISSTLFFYRPPIHYFAELPLNSVYFSDCRAPNRS